MIILKKELKNNEDKNQKLVDERQRKKEEKESRYRELLKIKDIKEVERKAADGRKK